MHIGAPSCGMNAAVRSFVRNGILLGGTVYGVNDGIEGLIAGNFRKMEWGDVIGWVPQGGAHLGTKRTLPGHRIKEVAARLEEFKIQGLFIVGGFEAFEAGLQLAEARYQYPQFCIPICIAPSTISNNVPGTDVSLGKLDFSVCINSELGQQNYPRYSLHSGVSETKNHDRYFISISALQINVIFQVLILH